MRQRMQVWRWTVAAGVAVALAGCSRAAPPTTMKGARIMTNQWNQLTPDEERVIVRKGTERPFSGRFEKLTDAGTYLCRRCGAALYRAEDKFDAGCGWPSFDAEVAGAVRRETDADDRRTEILCASCDGHLGHVFKGERLTPRDTRHCVNSVSLDFVPLADDKTRFARGVFAGGCFWGVEHLLREELGVIRTRVGYTGGRTRNPTYREVCNGDTGHAEAVEVVYDPRQITFERLARTFFELHDPTQIDGQGPDLGDQYRSAIFCQNAAQQEVAGKLIAKLIAQGLKVATRLEPAAAFWPAEDYHQLYYVKTGKQPYCHRRIRRFTDEPAGPPDPTFTSPQPAAKAGGG